MSTVDGLRLAFGTLTALPVRPPVRVDSAVARTAMLAAPLPGLLLGALSGAVLVAGMSLRAPVLATAAVAIGLVALATRGLHLDGLADTADGLAASYDRERALGVMRTGDVGPAGAVTLLLVMLVQVASLTALATPSGEGSAWGAGALVAIGVVSGRSVLPLLCARPWKAARSEGLGAAVVGAVPLPAALGLAAITLGALAGVSVVTARGVVHVVVGVVIGWVAALAVAAHASRRLGGVTGDVLGAAVEISTAATLLVLATPA
ncbi:MAG TPA: adenosylcobinamide-GDP ribazoletransferase [Actinomycetales bacterium]|nr:adenosylcobinamide-GDP ribazoletransferase [Actinomycetales bacterium]